MLKEKHRKEEDISSGISMPDYSYEDAKKIFITKISDTCREMRKRRVLTDSLSIRVEYSNIEIPWATGHIQLLLKTNNYNNIVQEAEPLFARTVSANMPITFLKIVFHNIEKEDHEEYNFFDEMEKSRSQDLKESIDDFFGGDMYKSLPQSVNGYKGLFSDIFDRLDGFFTNMPIDYSASLRATVSNKLKSGECLLPWIVVREIFKNKISQWAFGKYSKEDVDNQELIDLVNNHLLNERILVFSRAESGDILELTVQATLECKSAIILNSKDYKNMNTELEKAVKVVYSPFGYKKSVVDIEKIRDFCAFIEVFHKEKLSTAEKVAYLKKWINVLQDKNIVNSLAFCLLTGRRANEIERKELIEPFVVFDSDKEQSQKDIEKRREDEDCASVNDDYDDIFGEDGDFNDDFGLGSLFDDEDEEF